MYKTPTNIEQWTNHNAKLIAKQLQERDATITFNSVKPILFLLHTSQFLPLIAPGLQDWIKISPIKYISILQGEEANYIVFLDSDLNKFHQTYLAD